MALFNRSTVTGALSGLTAAGFITLAACQPAPKEPTALVAGFRDSAGEVLDRDTASNVRSFAGAAVEKNAICDSIHLVSHATTERKAATQIGTIRSLIEPIVTTAVPVFSETQIIPDEDPASTSHVSLSCMSTQERMARYSDEEPGFAPN